jgi:hypothetical protein
MSEHTPNRRIPVKIHRNVSLIRCADSATALEVASLKAMSDSLLGRLDERTLLVRHGDVKTVVEELRKAELHPRVID